MVLKKAQYFSRILLVALLLSSTEVQAQQKCSIFFAKIGQILTSLNPVARRNLPPEQAYLFGLEFTVTNENIVNEGNRNPKDFSLANNPLKKETLTKYWELLKEKCRNFAGCRSTVSSDKHGEALRLQFQDGFYFTVGNDSAVIEINAKPQTIEGFAKVKHYLDDFVFKLAAEVDLKPHQRAGQGHIHISRVALKENAMLLRNFFVDFQNRPEIIYGALGNHLLNSPPLSAQKPEQRMALKNLLSRLDHGRYSINDFINGVEREVYTSSAAGDWGSYEYYQAFNMTRLQKARSAATIEIRSFRPQRSTREFQLQTKLLSTWIEHLRKMDKPVEYNMADRHEFSKQEVVDAYHKLTAELGLPWNEYKELLPPHLINVEPTRG